MSRTVNLIYGEDIYILSETLKNIRKNSGVLDNINNVNMESSEIDDIIDELALPPFLGANKCVNIYNSRVFLNKDYEKIYEKELKNESNSKKDIKTKVDEGYRLYKYFRKLIDNEELYLLEGIHILFIEEKEKIKDIEKSSMYKLFLKNKQNHFNIYNCTKKTKIEKQKYFLDLAKKNNVNIDYNTIGYMLDNISDDTFVSIQEFNKIMMTNKGINGEKILIQDIDEICIKTDESKIFEISDAIIKQNKDRVLELVDGFKGQELMLIGYIYKYFRNIYLTILALEEKQEKNLLTILDLKPNQKFLINKYIEMARKNSKNKIKYILKEIMLLDEKMKTKTIDINTSIKNILILI
ncbi:MAG: DNA polymerase III subunit delta [Clostridium sp.]